MILAHALPRSVGAVPLTVIITALIGVYLATNAVVTRRATAGIGATTRAPGHAAPGHAAPGTKTSSTSTVRPTQTTRLNYLGVAGLVVVGVLASSGARDAAENLTDVFVLTLLWGTVALTSMLFGGWWPAVDPLRGVAGLMGRAIGDPGLHDVSDLPDRVGLGACVIGLLTWAHIQLTVRPTVFTFQLILIGYIVVHTGAVLRYGTAWLTRTESLNVLSRTLGLLRPGDGGPLTRLTAMADTTEVRAVSAVLIGWSLTDLVLETEWWHDLAVVGGVANWLGLLVLLAVVAALFGLVTAVGRRIAFGPAFVAVAGGWVFAHYLSILLMEGQGLPIWLSDPFATGANYLGRAGQRVNAEPIPLDLLAAIQAIPFALGHLLAVVVVNRRATAVVTDARQLGPATFFARAVIAVLLVGGIYLQLGGL